MAIKAPIAASDEWYAGEDKSLVFTIYQSNGTTAQDLTGWTLSWTLKRFASDLDVAAILTKTTVSGITLTTPGSGVATVAVADTDTDPIVPGLYHHELKRTNAGNETVLSYGTAVLRQALHRS
jgi:hypothetical protein